MPCTRVTIWLRVCTAIAILVFPCMTIGTSIVVVPTDYDNGTFAELIETYRQAYVAAGFKVGRQSTRREKGVGGRRITRLLFELLNAEKLGGKKGIVSFVVISPASGSCAPCSVFPELLGPEPAVQETAVWSAIYQRTLDADLKANAEIRMKLGKSVRSP